MVLSCIVNRKVVILFCEIEEKKMSRMWPWINVVFWLSLVLNCQVDAMVVTASQGKSDWIV